MTSEVTYLKIIKIIQQNLTYIMMIKTDFFICVLNVNQSKK